MITVNTTDYKDDFAQTDPAKGSVDKNYLRILFNGGRSVQIRELNQIQSTLQSQIDKFGRSIWKTGSAVIGGACTFDNKIHAISFSTPLVASQLNPVDISKIDTLVQGTGTSAIIADVLAYDSDSVTTTFYVRYSSGGGGDNTAGKFAILTEIALEARASVGVSALVISSEHSVVSGAFLSDGVFFINGSFVVTPKQDIFIPHPSVGDLNGSIVLEVSESIVTYLEDPTLLDNADGRPNHLAPGADRYQITLTLKYLDGAAPPDSLNRITLMRIKDGRVVQAVKLNYTDLDRVLAQRTYEESGNYILNPFKISIADLEGSMRPGSTDIDADEKVYIGLEPSVAYVDGYRVELSEKLDLIAPRAREVEEKKVSISLGIGNYVDVSIAAGSNIPTPNRIDITYDLRNGADAVIGTCRIKSIESVGSVGALALWRVFLYDIVMSGTNNISAVESIFYDNGTADVELNVAPNSTVQDTANDTAVFKLPYSNVRSVAAINPADLTYVIKKTYYEVGVNSSATGEYTITTGANETFGDASVNNFIVEVNGTLLPSNGFTVVSATTSSIKLGGLGNNLPVKVIFPVTVASNTPATKTLTQITRTSLAPVGNIYTLLTSDIYDVVSVIINGTIKPIKDVIVIEFDGQTPSKYTNSQLRYTGAGTAPIIDVVYRHFVHSGLPFTANSYPINWDDSTTVTGQIHYRDIPRFNENSLADCIDFRPTILVTPGTSTVIGAPLTAIQPDPNSMLTCMPTFFLPRVDKIIVNASGEFKIIRGVPKIDPVAQPTPPSSMALYELTFPSYTFDASDIQVKFIDNRRYTMRDIGKLDRRINNLEYYTSLSMLESSINNKSIFDSVQGSRFKNGMMVDSFSGHGVGNVFNPAYACSIDMGEQTLRPRFNTDAVDLVFNAATASAISVNENTITLAYTEAPLIHQLKSSESESVNPYDVATFIGTVKLFPTNDIWMEVNRRPDVIINDNGAYDSFKHLAEETNILGTEWNRWETKWKGNVTLGSKSKPHSVRAPDGKMRAAQTTTQTSIQEASGIKTSLGSSITSERLGERVVDISVIPFIRSRQIHFSVMGLKPSTKVYPFFDGINISDYTTTASTIEYPHQRTSVQEFFNKVPGDTGFIAASPLVSSANGSLIGRFTIPNNSLLKFKCGERVFKLTDSETNNTEEETTFAEGVYNAAGSSQTIEETIISTRVPEIKKERVTQTRVTTDVKIRYFDPLAQTFIINDVTEGAFVTSLDLWFTSKSITKIPVTVRLVAVDNGYPTQRVVPFSEVTLPDDEVNIGGELTNFKFSDPVYLKAGTEYAIVLLSNDPAYRIRVSRLGGTDEDNNIIQSNPYGGVMFMSQNASTWTPDQTRDMKFVLNRAVFNKTTPGYVEFKSIMREGIQSIGVSNGGVNYSNNTYNGSGVQLTGAVVTISAPPSGGTQAYARSVVDTVTGTVIGIEVTDPGSGYVNTPTVAITHLPTSLDTNAAAYASLYVAKTSAFSLMQGSTIHQRASLSNSLLFGSTRYSNIDLDETYKATSEFSITHGNRATIESSMTTTSEFITPVISLDTMALLSIENDVNSLLTNEDILDGGAARSRYITREAELNDPADQLNIYLDANRSNESTNVTLYVKLKYDSVTYSDWIHVEPQVKIPITSDVDSYEEVQYIYDSPNNDFISFAVKLVFTSASSVNVATVKNLRIIATS